MADSRVALAEETVRTKPKCKPRGNPRALQGHSWPKGVSGNPGGKPFIKIHQKLSVIAAEQLSSPADPDLCALVGAPAGATNGFCVVRAMILEAVTEKNVAAANFLFQCTEAAKVRIDLNEKKDVTLHVERDAHDVIAKLLRGDARERAVVEREQAACLEAANVVSSQKPL